MTTTTPDNYPQTARQTAFVPHALDYIALLLLITGGINWGVIGLMDINLVASLFGEDTVVSRAVYSLVGLAALYALSFLARFPRGR